MTLVESELRQLTNSSFFGCLLRRALHAPRRHIVSRRLFPDRLLNVGSAFWRSYAVGRLSGSIFEEFSVADPPNGGTFPKRETHMARRDNLNVARIIGRPSDQRATAISRDCSSPLTVASTLMEYVIPVIRRVSAMSQRLLRTRLLAPFA